MSAVRFALAMPFRVAAFILAGVGTVLVVVSIGFEMTERGKEEAKLNDLFSRAIRLRDPFCRIGMHRQPSTDAAHLYPKGAYPRLRWDLRNAVGACRNCHSAMTVAPLTWAAWVRANLNVHDWKDLMRIHLVGPSPDRADVRATLTAALANFRRAA